MPDNDKLPLDDSLSTYDLLKDDSPIDEEAPKEDLLAEEEPVNEKPADEAEEEIKLADEEESEDEEKVDEEKLEIHTPVRRKEILAKYPQLFKDFPYLETAYYREQQYTEILPTLDDAKEAVERSKQLEQVEIKLREGKTEDLLKSVKDNDPQAFAKLVDNYLPNLAKTDQQAYYHVVGTIVSTTVSAMVQEAKRLGNQDLEAAAVILNQFIYGSSEPRVLTKFSKDEPKDDSFEKEKKEFIQQRFNTVSNDLAERVNNVLKSTINNHLDPKGVMTDYVRRNATKDCLENLDKAIAEDSRFKSVLDGLWKRAFTENFSKESTDRIRSAYLAKAKSLLPTLIQRTRNEALRGLKRTDREDKDRKGPIAPGRSAAPISSGNKKNEIPRGMKTIDILNMD